jgi:hypothetical protein
MTTATQPRELWNTMPGWGIVANLLPPEVLQARRVRTIRKIVLALLCFLLILAAAGYAYAFMQSRSAGQGLAAEQSRTSQLIAEQHKYSGVTQIQGTVDKVQSQLSTLLAGDVDVSGVLGQVLAKVPAGSVISQVTVTLAVPSQGAAASQSGTTSLDTSGHLHIGTITLTGQMPQLTDVSTFVDGLSGITGVVEPFPTTNATTDKGAGFNVQVTLTDQLLSHRFDAKSTGGN